jgi:hypothetical protein
MIIGDLNVKSIAFLPSKANAILIVDSDAILARAIALQRLKPVRRRRREVSKFFRAVDLNQFPERDGSDGLKSPHWTLLENPFCILIAKRTDQTNIVLRIASNVRHTEIVFISGRAKPLLVPQGDYRIDPRRAVCGNPHRNQHATGKQGSNFGKGFPIQSHHAKEHARHELRERERRGQANR